MTDEQRLEEIRTRHTYALSQWGPIRDEAEKDMAYVAGDPWTEADRKKREAAGRPTLNCDELAQYHNQTVNDMRANPLGAKFAPTGGGANDKGAECYQNKAREIEYRSTADIAYITAAENAIQRSYGWIRWRTAHASDTSFDLDLWIDPIPNPDNVLPDPDFIWPDARDVHYLFYVEARLKAEFAREWPDAKIRDFTLDDQTLAPGWIQGDKIQMAEYWVKEPTTRQLHLLGMPGDPEPKPVFDDELQTALKDLGGGLPHGFSILRSRDVDTVKVRQYLTNGIEILDERDWPGKHIPFVACLGKVIWVKQQRKILSMTRLARDPVMLHAYLTSCEAEVVGAVPRNSWRGYQGQFLHPEQWQKAAHEPVAFLEAAPTVEGAPPGTVLPLPTRESWDPPLQGLEIAKESARRAIQAAMGISPLPTSALRHNEKSGKALQQIEDSGQKGSFHYVDHYRGMIQRAWVIGEDLMDKVIDTARDLWVRQDDNTAKKIRVNDPTSEDPIFLKGDYQVTVSAGPSDDSQREAADDFVDVMVGNLPVVAQLAGPQKALKLMANSVKLKQLGPIGDQIVELLDPPAPQGPDGKPMNPELQQAMAENQQLKQQLQQAADAIKSKQVEKQAEMQAQGQIETMKVQAQGTLAIKLQEMKDATSIAVAHIAAASKGLSLDAHAVEEAEAMGHEADQAALDRQHDLNTIAVQHQAAQMAASQQHDQALEAGDQAHAQDLESGDVAHRQALEQGDASAAHTMAQQQQAADLAPEPTDAA